MGVGRGRHVIVALSVTTTGETRPVSGMGMREGWIYRLENTRDSGLYVHANANFRPPNGAPIDFTVCHFTNSPLAPRFFDAYAYVIDDNVITESGHRSKDRSRRICINEVEILSFRKSLSSGDAISFRWKQRKLIMENNELECSKFAKNVEFNCCFAIVSIFFSKKIFRESSVKIHLYNKVFCQKVDID